MDETRLVQLGLPPVPDPIDPTADIQTRLYHINATNHFWASLLAHVRNEDPIITAQWKEDAVTQDMRRMYMSIYIKQIALCTDLLNEVLHIEKPAAVPSTAKFHSLNTQKPPMFEGLKGANQVSLKYWKALMMSHISLVTPPGTDEATKATIVRLYLGPKVQLALENPIKYDDAFWASP